MKITAMHVASQRKLPAEQCESVKMKVQLERATDGEQSVGAGNETDSGIDQNKSTVKQVTVNKTSAAAEAPL